MDAKKLRRPVPISVADATDDEQTDETPHGCQSCGKHIPIGEWRRLRMVEHDVEPELCLACQSDRQVKRQCGGVYVLRQDGYNRAQRRQIAQERAQAERHEETKRRRLERLLTQG